MTDISHILLLHGFMGSGSDWDRVRRNLEGKFRCLTPDITDYIPEFSGNSINYFEKTAKNLIEYLDNNNVVQCAVAGYSMGGRLALYLIAHNHHRFSSVLIESANPGILKAQERADRIKHDDSVARGLKSCDLEEFIDSWYEQPLFGKIKNHPEYPVLKQKLLKIDRKSVINSLRALGTGRQPSLWEALPYLELPMRFITGELDTKYTRIVSQAAALCPNGHSAIIPKCGHNTHFEDPEGFAEDIVDFCF